MFLDNSYDRESFVNFCAGFLKDFIRDERDFELDGNEKSICQLGKSKELNLSILEFSIKSEDRNKRIAITQDAFKILRRHHIRNALIAFKYDGDEWRLSLLTSTLRLDEDGKVVKEESNPRRYSYLLGPSAKTKTPYQFLVGRGKVADFNDLLGRFSMEVVNKQFYNSIAELFMQLVGGKRNDKNRISCLQIVVLSQHFLPVHHYLSALKTMDRQVFQSRLQLCQGLRRNTVDHNPCPGIF